MSLPPELNAPAVPEGAVLFNRYHYLREIGRGGMGRVILARDEVLAIEVALKLVPDEVVRDAGGLRDLKREVLRGMALTHPNIVRVHSFEQDQAHGAIVMEYVEGETLGDAKLLQPQGCFDHETLRPWLEQLCSVLDHAHREVKIAHRDLKPRNILLTRDRRIKVADFGISCSLSDTVHRLTTHVDPIGTPPYMSPQQAMGETPSHLDDIYSLGATLYDLLTGKPPFYRGNVVMQVLQNHAPSIAQRRRELGKDLPPVPPPWETLIAACLSKNPGDRPAGGREVMDILRGASPAIVIAAARQGETTPSVPRDGDVTERLERTELMTQPAPALITRRPWKRRLLRQTASLVFTSVLSGAFCASLIYLVRQAPTFPEEALTPAPVEATPTPVPPGGRFQDFGRATDLQPARGLERQQGEAERRGAAPARPRPR
jgi:serine/threonine protein kinase